LDEANEARDVHCYPSESSSIMEDHKRSATDELNGPPSEPKRARTEVP
jgi:hypothetical protein